MIRQVRHHFAWIMLIFSGVNGSAISQGFTLDQAVQEALAHNPDIFRADQEFKAVKGALWEGISPEYPEAFLEVEGVPEGSGWTDYAEKKMGLSQALEFPLTYYYRGRSYRFDTQCMVARVRRVKNSLVRDVKKAFYRVLMLEEQQELYEEMTRIARDQFEMARLRVFAGESSSYDTLRVRVDLADAENRLLALKQDNQMARGELALLLGRDRGEDVEVEGSLQAGIRAPERDSLYTLALAHHPILAEARASVSQHRTQSHLAWMGLIPRIHVKVFQMELAAELRNRAWGGEVGLSIPLWFFLKGQGDIRSAAHRLRSAEFTEKGLLRRVLLDVDEASSRFYVAEKQLQRYRESTLLEVDELVRIATRSYEEGEMGYLEVSEALRTSNRIKAEYLEALYAYQAAYADLEEATGILLNR